MFTSITVAPVSLYHCPLQGAGLTSPPLIRRRALTFHTRQCLRDPLEQELHIMADLGARLDEHEIVLTCLLLPLLFCDFSLVRQIRLVADEDNDDVVAAFATNIIYPFSRLVECLCVLRQSLSAGYVLC